MKNSNKRFFVFLVVVSCAFLPFHELSANGIVLSPNSRIPKMTFQGAVSADTVKYLGLNRNRYFSIDTMQGSFFIIEVFNTYCTSCPRDVPILNEVFTTIERDAAMKGKVKVFAIAIGNTDREAESYKTQHHVLFPILIDLDFAIHNALGNPRVPYTMYIRKTPKGNVVVDTHQGVLDSAETVLKKVRALNEKFPLR